MKQYWRIDDVSLNTDLDKLGKFTRQLTDVVEHEWLLVICPVVFKAAGERPFPRDMKPISDITQFFQGTKIGMPELARGGNIYMAAHGMFHIDHRLLVPELQEYSILQSCAIVGTRTFVPPYNYYNHDTVMICRKHGIDLIRWGDEYSQPWKHVLHNKFDPNHTHYYFHTFDLEPQQFAEWRLT